MHDASSSRDSSPLLAPGSRRAELRFRKIVCGDVVAYVDPLYAEAVAELGMLEPGGFERTAARSLTAGAEATASGTAQRRARGPSAVIELPGHSKRLHLRLFHHGGWLGGALGRHLFGLTRPLAELRANAALAGAGAPVPRPVVAIGERSVGPFFRSAFGTLHLEGAMDGVQILRSAIGAGSRSRALAAASEAGSAIRRFHDTGARHPDLHLGNLLFCPSPQPGSALVIDLDRVEIGPPPAPRGRMAELMRLYRSVIKRGLDEALGARGRAHFLDAYTRGDRALRRALLDRLPIERARLALHRLTYG